MQVGCGRSPRGSGQGDDLVTPYTLPSLHEGRRSMCVKASVSCAVVEKNEATIHSVLPHVHHGAGAGRTNIGVSGNRDVDAGVLSATGFHRGLGDKTALGEWPAGGATVVCRPR